MLTGIALGLAPQAVANNKIQGWVLPNHAADRPPAPAQGARTWNFDFCPVAPQRFVVLGRPREALSSCRTIDSSIPVPRNLIQSGAGMGGARGRFVAVYVANRHLFGHRPGILVPVRWLPSALYCYEPATSRVLAVGWLG